MEEIFDLPVPITETVSTHPWFIDRMFQLAYPDLEECDELMTEIINRVGKECHDFRLTLRENLKILHFKSEQIFWKMALEKGRGENHV